MPLVKSKTPEAFRKNVKAEVAAGKPVKQAVAIAYSVKREAEKKKKYHGRPNRHRRRRSRSCWRFS
jgi:predicted RNase H-like nuclease (RuvC/YqgF family)